MWTMNFQMFKLVLEKAEESEIKLPISAGSLKKQESSRQTSISALFTMPKPLTVWITINCGKFFKNFEEFQNLALPFFGMSGYLTCLLRNLYAGQEATVINQQRQCVTISYMDNWLIIVKTNKFICLPYIFLYFLAKLKTFWNKIGEFIYEPGVWKCFIFMRVLTTIDEYW